METTLNVLPCGVDDIMPSLERGYYLQYFNRRTMGMGDDTSSHLRHACGYVKPERLYPYPPADEILDYMAEYPITQTFGETYTSCMKMKRSDWVRLKRRAKQLPPRPAADPMIQIRDLLKGIIDVYTKQPTGQTQSPSDLR